MKPGPKGERLPLPFPLLSPPLRLPGYSPQVYAAETLGNNMTAKWILEERSNIQYLPKNPFRQVNPKAGEYAYSTDNAFEQEIYFGNAGPWGGSVD